MICLTIHHDVVNYDYDHDLAVLIVTIGGLLIINAQTSMNAHHYCVGYCVYLTAIDHHHEMMARCHHLCHRHQAHLSTLMADYLDHSVRESGHILIESHRYLAACHSDQI